MDDLSTIEADLQAGLDGMDMPATASDGADRHPDDSAWTVKPKAEPEREPSIEATIADALDKAEQAGGDADADRQWQRELRKLSDEALKRWSIDPAARHEHGLSRRQIARRLFNAEAALKADPLNALPAVVADYTAGLDPSRREAAARSILARLGFQSPDGLDQAARQRLAAYDQQQHAQRQAFEQAVPRVQAQVAQFKAQRPDFDQLAPVMSALVSAGQARTISEAYDMARAARGMPAYQQAQAQTEAERRRLEVAKAKAAGTPQTKAAPGRAVEVDRSGRSTKEMLEDAWDTIGVGA